MRVSFRFTGVSSTIRIGSPAMPNIVADDCFARVPKCVRIKTRPCAPPFPEEVPQKTRSPYRAGCAPPPNRLEPLPDTVLTQDQGLSPDPPCGCSAAARTPGTGAVIRPPRCRSLYLPHRAGNGRLLR